jgi:hypothetical protein
MNCLARWLSMVQRGVVSMVSPGHCAGHLVGKRPELSAMNGDHLTGITSAARGGGGKQTDKLVSGET